MSLFNPSQIGQAAALAGSLSLLSGAALAQETAAPPPLEGRAGIATLCIETRSAIDPVTKKPVAPSIYIDKMPDDGIKTGYVKGGPVAAQWKEFLNPTDPKRKAWLASTDIPDQANAAFALMARLDKNGDGDVTPEEFEKGEKGKSEEDKLTDLAFLTSLRCDDLFFTEGALAVDVGKFPEVIALNGELAGAKAKAGGLQQALTQTQKALNNAVGFGFGAAILAFGLGYLISKKKHAAAAKPKADAPKPAQPAAENAPKTEKIKLVKPGKAVPPPMPQEAPKLEPTNYDDIIDGINAGAAEAPGGIPAVLEPEQAKAAASAAKPANDPATPSEDVLKALEEQAPAVAEAKAPGEKQPEA